MLQTRSIRSWTADGARLSGAVFMLRVWILSHSLTVGSLPRVQRTAEVV